MFYFETIQSLLKKMKEGKTEPALEILEKGCLHSDRTQQDQAWGESILHVL